MGVFAPGQASRVGGLSLNLVDEVSHASFGRPLTWSFDLVFRLVKVNNAPIFLWREMSEITWTRVGPLCRKRYRL